MVVSVKRAAEVLKACLKRRRVISPTSKSVTSVVPEMERAEGELSAPLCPVVEPEAETSTTLPRVRLDDLPDDILTKVFAWLSFEEIHDTIRTCRALYRFRRKRSVFRVLCQLRWPQSFATPGGGPKPVDPSMPPNPRDPVCRLSALPKTGGAPQFVSCKDWYCHVLARATLERQLKSVYDPHNQLLCLAESLVKFPNCEDSARPALVESVRWVVELWDKFTLIHGKDWDLKYPLSVGLAYNQAVLRLMSWAVDEGDREITFLTAKAIGILCRDEKNRILIGNAQGVESLVSLLCTHLDDPQLVEVVIWSLVHHSRPVGGIEGESYDVDVHTDYDININRMWEAGCLDNCIQICETHKDKPSVLAKVFWLIVNLSLPETRKDAVLAAPVVKYAVEALKRYPDHWELNYRAVFSLVNICCYLPVKSKFIALGGFTHLSNVMKRWPKNHVLQRTALNVVKGFSTTQIDNDTLRDGITTMEDHRAMFTLVCTAMRQYGVLRRIEDSVNLFERTSEEEFPGADSAAELARWMYDLVAINAH